MHSYAPKQHHRPQSWDSGDLLTTGIVLMLVVIGLRLFSWIDSWPGP